MKKSAVRRFGAFVDPERIYVIEYRRDATGIEILDHLSAARSFPEIEDAADGLVELMRTAKPSKESRMAVAVRGFGISYHLLTLPPAGAEILAPIVDRELKRLFPEVPEPVIGFAVGGHIDRRTGKPSQPRRGLTERRGGSEEVLPLEILAAITPRHVVDVLSDTLASARIQLDHLTIVPQAMARMYREVSGSSAPTACAIMLPAAPVIGVFQGADVRFIAEPPPSLEAQPDVDIQTVIDQVARARIYLRQQFRGADIERMYVAADPTEESHVASVLNAALSVDVQPLAPTMGPPAAIVALGAVLNSDPGTEMALYPSQEELQALLNAKRVRSLSKLAMAASIIAVVFAVGSTFFAWQAADDLRKERAAADAQMSRVGPAMDVISQRRANRQRAEGLDAQRSGRQQLARLLNGIRLAQPPNVGVSSASLTRTETGWRADITGTSIGNTGAQALRGVDSFYRELPMRIPLQALSLDAFDYASGEADVSGNFKISFTTTAAAGTAR